MYGEQGLIRRKPIPHQLPNPTTPDVVEKVLHLRRNYHLGPIRIVWYLERYHPIRSSDTGVYQILKHHRLNRLQRKVGRQAVHTKRYNQEYAIAFVNYVIEKFPFRV